MNSWTPAQMPSQTGRRFFITGANSGIGFWAAVELARHGATVVLACRDQARGAAALDRLKQEAAGPASAADLAELVLLNLASLDSVRQVAAAQSAGLDGLINNAGVMAPSRRLETHEGFELQFGTNVLGHFALTAHLFPHLLPGSRVVTLASIAHKRGKLAFDDLQSRQSYNPMRAYSQSKLADLMFALALDRRLRARQAPVESIAVHPGVAQTNLFKVGSSTGIARTAERALQSTIGLLLNSETAGALPTLYAATAPDAQPGGYYGPQGFQEMRGNDVGPAQIIDAAKDVSAQDHLWQVCEQLTGTSFL